MHRDQQSFEQSSSRLSDLHFSDLNLSSNQNQLSYKNQQSFDRKKNEKKSTEPEINFSQASMKAKSSIIQEEVSLKKFQSSQTDLNKQVIFDKTNVKQTKGRSQKKIKRKNQKRDPEPDSSPIFFEQNDEKKEETVKFIPQTKGIDTKTAEPLQQNSNLIDSQAHNSAYWWSKQTYLKYYCFLERFQTEFENQPEWIRSECSKYLGEENRPHRFSDKHNYYNKKCSKNVKAILKCVKTVNSGKSRFSEEQIAQQRKNLHQYLEEKRKKQENQVSLFSFDQFIQGLKFYSVAQTYKIQLNETIIPCIGFSFALVCLQKRPELPFFNAQEKCKRMRVIMNLNPELTEIGIKNLQKEFKSNVEEVNQQKLDKKVAKSRKIIQKRQFEETENLHLDNQNEAEVKETKDKVEGQKLVTNQKKEISHQFQDIILEGNGVKQSQKNEEQKIIKRNSGQQYQDLDETIYIIDSVKQQKLRKELQMDIQVSDLIDLSICLGLSERQIMDLEFRIEARLHQFKIITMFSRSGDSSNQDHHDSNHSNQKSDDENQKFQENFSDQQSDSEGSVYSSEQQEKNSKEKENQINEKTQNKIQSKVENNEDKKGHQKIKTGKVIQLWTEPQLATLMAFMILNQSMIQLKQFHNKYLLAKQFIKYRPKKGIKNKLAQMTKGRCSIEEVLKTQLQLKHFTAEQLLTELKKQYQKYTQNPITVYFRHEKTVSVSINSSTLMSELGDKIRQVLEKKKNLSTDCISQEKESEQLKQSVLQSYQEFKKKKGIKKNLTTNQIKELHIEWKKTFGHILTQRRFINVVEKGIQQRKGGDKQLPKEQIMEMNRETFSKFIEILKPGEKTFNLRVILNLFITPSGEKGQNKKPSENIDQKPDSKDSQEENNPEGEQKLVDEP